MTIEPRATPPLDSDLRYFRSPGNRRVRKRRLVRVGLKWGAIAAAHAAIAVIVLWSGSRLVNHLATSPRFALDRVEVRGASRTTENEIRRALTGSLGRSVLSLDLEELGRRVETLGWVERAAVKRILPRGLLISVTERTPRARVPLAGGAYLLDPTGRVLAPADGREWDELPLIRGLGTPGAPGFERAARHAVAMLDRLHAAEPRWYGTIAELDVSEPSWVAARGVDPGPQILLDPSAIERNLEHYLALSEEILNQIGPAEVVDLRWKDRIAVRPVPERPIEQEPPVETGES